jgi:hypothetical protein
MPKHARFRARKHQLEQSEVRRRAPNSPVTPIPHAIKDK